MERKREFWVISPNVNNNEKLVDAWRREILKSECAYIGWGGEDHLGSKFANEVQDGDVILIARRHDWQPQVFGFGVTTGKPEQPNKNDGNVLRYGSRRKLSPFVPLTRSPRSLPLLPVVNDTKALRLLHPDRNDDHRKVCEWMERELPRFKARLDAIEASPDELDARLTELQRLDESEYQVRGRGMVAIATREEARLINEYIKWLRKQDRELHIARYGSLCCDAFEKERRNLIEAKRSTQREYIRMAAGQLLDYAFAGRDVEEFRNPNMAILLPEKPNEKDLGWLKNVRIHLAWREGKIFTDNCDGQFT